MKRYTHLVWDFNGTILNDVEACFRSANALLRDYGLPQIESIDAYREVFGFPVIDYYVRLGFDFERLSFAKLAVEWVEYYRRFSRSATVYTGIPEILSQAKKCGAHLSILSATERSMLEEQTTELGVRQYFDELWGMDNIRAESKLQLAEHWRREHPQAVALFIGDTEHDADAAWALGADCVLIAAGHRPRHALERCDGAEVLDRVEDLPISRLIPTI